MAHPIQNPKDPIRLLHENWVLVEKHNGKPGLVHKNWVLVENIPKARILQMSEGLLTLYLHEKTISIIYIGDNGLHNDIRPKDLLRSDDKTRRKRDSALHRRGKGHHIYRSDQGIESLFKTAKAEGQGLEEVLQTRS